MNGEAAFGECFSKRLVETGGRTHRGHNNCHGPLLI
jgi:hypothetical protein